MLACKNPVLFVYAYGECRDREQLLGNCEPVSMARRNTANAVTVNNCKAIVNRSAWLVETRRMPWFFSLFTVRAGAVRRDP